MLLEERQRQLAERLELTEGQHALVLQARELGRAVIGPAANRVDRDGDYPREAIEALKGAGLTALAVPAGAGGFGAGYRGDVVALPLVLMEIASWCSSASQVLALHNSAVQYIHALGEKRQADFFFAEVREGAMFGSFGSENRPDRASLQMRSKLTRVEGGYLLEGDKRFATGSPGAKWAFWHSVLAEEADNPRAPLAMPIVALDSPGITVHGDWDGLGQRGTGSGTVTARQAFVPERQLIGRPGAFAAFGDFFAAQFNVHFAAQFTGIAYGAYREALRYAAGKRAAWTSADAADSVLALRLGDMSAKLAASRQLVLQAARLLQAYQEAPELLPTVRAAASHAKIIATETALEVTSGIFQTMGARSATRENNFDMYYRNARTLTLHDPVDKHRETAGRLQLGELDAR
ncbi:acyl-CoA dehydrogenase family protein [Cohnella boryungensis]|uniref:Acyl-CoA dehydrogenase family protein n=1 Tax=Cohnella boryungensis TaxID=768479 RepID=A0ABV8S453_9BACL